MLKGKHILLLLCPVLLFGATANAEKTEIAENSPAVTITEDAGGAEAGMLVTAKKGADIENDDNIYAMTYAEAVDGKLVFTFDMQDERNGEATDGEYDFYIRRQGKDTLTGSFVYASTNSRKAVTDAVKNASSANDIYNIFSTEAGLTSLRATGCDTDSYTLSEDKKEIASVFYDNIPDMGEINEGNIAKSFNLAISAVNINNTDDTDKYLSLAGFTFEGESYTEITSSSLKEWIVNSIDAGKPYDTLKELEEAYACSIMLYNIRDSRQTTFEDTLKKYAKGLGITSDDAYEDYIDTKNKNKLNEKILTAIKKKTLLDVESLLNIIEEKLESASEGSSGGSGGGGGGSSSGRGSSGTVNADGYVSSVPVSDTAKPADKQTYSDMGSASWATEAVMKMTEENIISGNGDGTFNPNGLLTREAFVKMLVLASGTYDENADCDFRDVSENEWYYKYVASAVKAGLVSGTDQWHFGTGKSISRQDMAVLCYRYAKNNKNLQKVRNTVEFADSNSISDYAKEAVDELYSAEIINGVGNNSFDPAGTATRAQGAVIIYNLFFRG